MDHFRIEHNDHLDDAQVRTLDWKLGDEGNDRSGQDLHQHWQLLCKSAFALSYDLAKED